MTTTSHPLDETLRSVRLTSHSKSKTPEIVTLAEVYENVDLAAYNSLKDFLNGAYPHFNIAAGRLVTIAAKITDKTFKEIAADIRSEYDRANTEHNGNTPLNPAMSDEQRAAILMEELGEVARCLTPDAHTETGHAGDLYTELIQAATMAAAWSQHITNTFKKENN